MLRSESACAAGLIAMSADQYHTLALTPFGRDGATNVLVPAVESLYRKRLAADSGDDPIRTVNRQARHAFCRPSPRRSSTTPGVMLLLHEHDTTFRQIFMDGRPLPEDPFPT
jgi:hypothetical protein